MRKDAFFEGDFFGEIPLKLPKEPNEIGSWLRRFVDIQR